jgi:hypothetical protein
MDDVTSSRKKNPDEWIGFRPALGDFTQAKRAVFPSSSDIFTSFFPPLFLFVFLLHCFSSIFCWSSVLFTFTDGWRITQQYLESCASVTQMLPAHSAVRLDSFYEIFWCSIHLFLLHGLIFLSIEFMEIMKDVWAAFIIWINNVNI